MYSRKCPLSLDRLSALSVLKIIRLRASEMETEYMLTWINHQLSTTSKYVEQSINVRVLDTEQVVQKYIQHKDESESRKRKRKRRKNKDTSISGIRKKKKDGLGIKIVRGIPEGASVHNYIRYRKCKYIQDIKDVRYFLQSRLNSVLLNHLMSTLSNVAQFNNQHEHGLLTLQAMLMNGSVTHFRIASAKLHYNFVSGKTIGNTNDEYLETRIGTTILHYILVDGTRLTHLDLERCACDSLLSTLSHVSTNLIYLNISGSIVSDVGLLALCGVETSSYRPKLSRACKRSKGQSEGESIVKNEFPRFSKRRSGCDKIQHLVANNLLHLDWSSCSPAPNSFKYYDFASVPLDSSFVAILMYLKDLRVFLTEVGVRTIESFIKVHKKLNRQKVVELKLEAVSDRWLYPHHMPLLNETCPVLSEISVLDSKVSKHKGEYWIDLLRVQKNLVSIKTKNIDFQTNKIGSAIHCIGSQFTNLDFRELWKFTYSHFRSVKNFCPNLEHFTMCMTSQNVANTMDRIEVDKDFNFSFHEKGLSQLKTLNISGPFGSDVIKYLIKGCEKLRSLSLGIEWPELTFCDAQPSGVKDILGIEYLEELLSVNPCLLNLEELHLVATYKRGRRRLGLNCAQFVMQKFIRLKHMGNFDYWKLSPWDVHLILHEARLCNRDIIFDEELYTRNTSPFFEYKYIEGRHRFSCTSHFAEKTGENSSGSMGFLNNIHNIFDVFVANHGLVDSGSGEDDEDDDEDSLIDEILSDNDESDEFNGDEDGNEDIRPIANPACYVM